jgi:tRNA-Thr(GGU) m(6)t(6)A37 methyltransferase TsaA
MASKTDHLLVHPIGTIHSPFTQQAGTPTQPRSSPGTEGRVTVLPEYAAGLLDLEGFERIWLVYWFDRAKSPELAVIPYHDTKPHGLFATRAPARINPIGISTVRLLAVDGAELRVGEIDVLDGTPLIDIKPYIPEFDAYPEAYAGWLAKAPRVTGPVKADGRFAKP